MDNSEKKEPIVLEHIGFRLRDFRENSGIKMPEIAAITGIAKDTLYKWERGTKPSDLNEFFKLKLYLDKMENRQQEETFDLAPRKPFLLRLPFDKSKPAAPYQNNAMLTGTVILTNNEPEIIVERINAPFLGLVEGAIRITDDTMAPQFPVGSWVVISRLKNIRILYWGYYYYIVDSNLEGILRRIFPGGTKGTLKLVSDNEDQAKYPPVELPWDRIRTIFKVMGGIKRLAM